EIRTEMAAVRSMMRDIENEMKELQEKRDIAYRNMVSKSSEAEGLKDKIDIKRDILNGFLVRIAETRDKLAQFEAEAKSLEIEIESPLPSMDSIKTRIRQAERSLEMMGNVNLRAIEDYEEKKARYDSLCEEIDRLEAQREELLSLMDRLSKEKKTVFNEVFKAVDRNFRSIYAELSGGGEAYLSLEDSEDPFLGGLIINAKPRNGKLLRLEALSGGEKSLTALAFIFALQEYQPSPFYLLDEVDMFLDAVNAEMVAKRVKDSCSRAQFVQISLRKVTLSKADHLIGVTRQPNGVSKVIMEPNMADIAKDLEKVEGSA
ncbi:MAG TPA: AAA family ATPase, partial [Candidatus Methanomethylophilaceae archaeon]|nr:AAA family ATPase [Candidatus Methanomethylophilaceae archaeon]